VRGREAQVHQVNPAKIQGRQLTRGELLDHFWYANTMKAEMSVLRATVSPVRRERKWLTFVGTAWRDWLAAPWDADYAVYMAW